MRPSWATAVYYIETKISTTLTSILLYFFFGVYIYIYIYITSIYWSAFTRITLNLSQNPVMAKQQLHFFELRAGRSRNVKKGGDLMGMDLVLLDGKVTETFSFLSSCDWNSVFVLFCSNDLLPIIPFLCLWSYHAISLSVFISLILLEISMFQAVVVSQWKWKFSWVLLLYFYSLEVSAGCLFF